MNYSQEGEYTGSTTCLSADPAMEAHAGCDVIICFCRVGCRGGGGGSNYKAWLPGTGPFRQRRVGYRGRESLAFQVPHMQQRHTEFHRRYTDI